MSELAQLRDDLHSCRTVVKGTIRALRGTLQFLTDLEERLDALDAQPEEAQREHNKHPGRTRSLASNGVATRRF